MRIVDRLSKPNIGKLKKKKDIGGLIKAANYGGKATYKTLGVQREAMTALKEMIAESISTRNIETIRSIFHDAYDIREVSREAVRAMGILKDKNAVKSLIEIVKRPIPPHLDPIERSAEECFIGSAIFALGEIKDESAVEPLIEILHREPVVTIQALSKIKDTRAVEPLIGFIHTDSTLPVQREVRKFFKEMKEIALPQILEGLEECLRSEKDYVRRNAVETFELIAGNIETDERMVQALMEGLQKGVEQESLYGAYALFHIGGATAVKVMDLLMNNLNNKKEGVRHAVANSLESIDRNMGLDKSILIDKNRFQILIEAAKDRNSIVRSSAVQILGNSGHEAAIEPLLKALGDEDGHIRLDAAAALCKYQLDQNVVGYLVKALESEEWGSTAGIIIGMLGRIDSDQTKNVLEYFSSRAAMPYYPWSRGDDYVDVANLAKEALERIKTIKR